MVIPVYNEADYLPMCLDSLLAQDYPLSRVEILVVDGRSDDGSRAIVGDYASRHSAPEIRLLDNPDRLPATALNIGVRESRGDCVIRLDGHATAAPDFVSKSVSHLRSTDAACVGGTIHTVGRGRVGEAIALAMSSPLGVGNAYFRYSREQRDVDTVAFGAYPRTLFDKVGGFDPDLEFAEDNEFNHRVRKAGGRIVLCPDIRTYYYCRSTLRGLFRQYRNYGAGRWSQGLQDPGAINLRQTAPLLFFATLAVLAVLATKSTAAWIALPALIGIYLSAIAGGSVWIAARNGWRHLALLPTAFMTMHVAYALGSLRAILERIWR